MYSLNGSRNGMMTTSNGFISIGSLIRCSISVALSPFNRFIERLKLSNRGDC